MTQPKTKLLSKIVLSVALLMAGAGERGVIKKID